MSEDEARELIALREERASWEEERAMLRALLRDAANYLDTYWSTHAEVDEDGNVEDEYVSELVREIGAVLDRQKVLDLTYTPRVRTALPHHGAVDVIVSL